MFTLIDLSPGAARKRFRQSIKDEWGECAYCGRAHDEAGQLLVLTLDHVRPRAYGGSSLRSNLVAACRRCNAAKGSERDWRGWYVQQSFFCGERLARIEAWLKPAWFHCCEEHAPSEADNRAAVLTQARSNGSTGSESRRANRGALRLLGGAILAEADLCLQQSRGRFLLPDRGAVTHAAA